MNKTAEEDRGQVVLIGDRPVGPGHPCFVIAELSGNHLGDLGRALALVDAAAEAGADAVKTQTYTADTMTLDSSLPPFQIRGGTLWDGRTLYDVYQDAATPWEWQEELAGRAATHHMDFFSSVFDRSSVDFLASIGVRAYKIASAEIVDTGLIEAAAGMGRPLLISTGMATIAEIDNAVCTANASGNGGVALLKCNSSYPARFDELHLRTIPMMADMWQVPVGLSDHTPGAASAVAAVALGACMVEKHITLRRADGGPDAAFSMEPEEFADLVVQVRAAEAALGLPRFGPTATEQASLLFRRSLFVVRDIRAGETFDEGNVRSIRPADGLPPKYLPDVLGRQAACDISAGTPLRWNLIH